MRVVYAYRSFSNRCDLIDNPWEAFLFKVSLISWMKYAPTVERVFYCDRTVYDFIDKNRILDLLDTVHVVDFKSELNRRYPLAHQFFAYPKLWAMCQQTEPFFICDTDGILRQNISNWFDSEKIYAVYYPAECSSRTPDYTPELALQKLNNCCTGSPTLRSFCDYTNTINAGLLYFPDARIGQIVGHMVLTLGTDIQCALVKSQERVGSEGDLFIWTLYEESLLSNLITFVSKQKIETLLNDKFEECSGIDGTKRWMISQVEKAIVNLKFTFLRKEFEDLKKNYNPID